LYRNGFCVAVTVDPSEMTEPSTGKGWSADSGEVAGLRQPERARNAAAIMDSMKRARFIFRSFS